MSWSIWERKEGGRAKQQKKKNMLTQAQYLRTGTLEGTGVFIIPRRVLI